MGIDLAQLVGQEVRAFLQPLASIAEADDPALSLRRFLGSCGWSIDGVVDPGPVLDLVDGLEDACRAFEDGLVPDSLTGAIERFQAIATLVDSVRTLGASVASLGVPGPISVNTLEVFGADVTSRLLITWVQSKTALLEVATVLGLVDLVDVPATTGGSFTRPAGQRLQLHPERLAPNLGDPVGALTGLFAPDGWDEPEGAVVTNLVLRSALGPLVRAMGGRWAVDPDLLRRGDRIAEIGRQSVVSVPVPGAGASVDVELDVLSATDHAANGASGPALSIRPHGTFSSQHQAGDWVIDTTASLLVGGSEPETLPAVTIGPDGVDTDAGVTASVELAAQHPLDLVLGSGRTGLTLGDLQLGLFGSVEDGRFDAGFSVAFLDSSVGISTADFGRVVSAILQFDATVPFDLGLEWSLDGGLRLAGSASLELLLSQGFDLGIVRFEDVMLALGMGDPFEITVSSEVIIVLGPLTLSFHRVGLTFVVTLGELHLAIAAETPTRIVITVESEGVNGGGFLEIDPENGRYAGGLALDIFGFGLSAIVIVDTELPGGGDGWALFGSLGLEFPEPIPIGFGFTLNGVGGLLALNRSIDIDALAGSLSTGAADAILFPDNLEEDADAVLAGLDSWFPVQDGSTVFGPVVLIGWGSPETLITAQLGVIISLPDLVIALLGSVEVLLPTPEEAVLSLRMDILGAVDIPASTVIVAASLHDSNLLGIFELSGDMGFYARLAEQPLFVLSIGGYHPQFDPPGCLPCWLLDLRKTRAAVELGENVEIVLTSYVAVTSNTFQFGGSFRLEASVEVALTTYSAEGWFGVNVLLVLKPFKIVARATAGVSISAGDKELFGVDLSARVEGPQPWYATGRATFTFFGFDVDFGFDVGTRPGGEPREVHDVCPDVVEALEAAAAWEPAEPADPWSQGVIVGDELPEGLWVRPDQVVEMRQSIAPLNRSMTAYGEATPATDRVDVGAVTLGGTSVASPDWVDDWFAPAQFDRLDDTSRLSAPSYELMTAGVRFGDDGIVTSADPVTDCASVSRLPEESIFPDRPPVTSAYRSPARVPGARPTSRTVIGPKLSVKPTGYTLVRASDGGRADQVLDDAGVRPSLRYATAVRVLADRPDADRARLKIVPAHAAVEVSS